MSFIDLFKGKGPSGFGARSTAEEVTDGIDLSGKNILITGANSGLGAESARVLAKRGAKIYCAARSTDKAAAAAERVGGVPVVCELTDLKSVAHATDALEGVRFDIVLCNAGIMAPPKLETIEGVERQLFTNHVGHFTLVTKLMDQLADDANVVVVSSYGHTMAPRVGIDFDNLGGQNGYSAIREYGQSKLANVLFAFALARRFESSRRRANAIHPGVVDTALGRENGLLDAVWKMTKPLYTKSVECGASTQCFVAAHPSLNETSGKYFVDCNEHRCSKSANDEALAEKLWTTSEEIVARVLGVN